MRPAAYCRLARVRAALSFYQVMRVCARNETILCADELPLELAVELRSRLMHHCPGRDYIIEAMRQGSD